MEGHGVARKRDEGARRREEGAAPAKPRAHERVAGTKDASWASAWRVMGPRARWTGPGKTHHGVAEATNTAREHASSMSPRRVMDGPKTWHGGQKDAGTAGEERSSRTKDASWVT